MIINCKDLNNFDILLYGIGNDFKKYSKNIIDILNVVAVSDSNVHLENQLSCQYQFIKPNEIKQKLSNPFVIIVTSYENYDIISKYLNSHGIPNCHYQSLQNLDLDERVVRLSDYVGQTYQDNYGNIIDIHESNIISKNAYILFSKINGATFDPKLNRPKNCIIKIGKNNIINNFSINILLENNFFNIGDDNSINSASIILSNGSTFDAGCQNSFEEFSAYVCENGSVIIGNDCMFSHNIEFWQSDTHAIYDLRNNKRINISEPIIIGDHVWLGTNVKLMSGAVVGSGSMVGAATVTSKKFPSNCIIAGNPGRLLREGIFWERDSLIWMDNLS